jgi:hypothetical protein
MHFEGIFQPADKTLYNAEAADFIGKRLAIQQGWVIDDGPFKGQQCFYAPNTTIGSIPASDLQELKSIPFARWQQIYNSIDAEDN